jgi:hypothetical protein
VDVGEEVESTQVTTLANHINFWAL